jgi:hypothetical protein
LLPWAKYAFTPSNGTSASGRLNIGLGKTSEIFYHHSFKKQFSYTIV